MLADNHKLRLAATAIFTIIALIAAPICTPVCGAAGCGAKNAAVAAQSEECHRAVIAESGSQPAKLAAANTCGLSELPAAIAKSANENWSAPQRSDGVIPVSTAAAVIAAASFAFRANHARWRTNTGPTVLNDSPPSTTVLRI